VSLRRRRVTVAVAVAIAVLSGGAAGLLSFGRGEKAEAAASAPTAPVLSPRRAPVVLRTLVADTRLAARVDTLMRSLSATSCVVVRADAATILSRRPDALLTPASALKLTTAAAFLSNAGGKGHFTTTLTGKRPDSNGTVASNVVIVGGGDPLLATSGYVVTRKHPPKPATDVAQFVTALQRAGVKHIAGGIGVYDGVFDSERRVPTWSAGYTATGDVGPLGALAIDDGFSSYAPLVAAPDPALAAGTTIKAALVAAGIAVDGNVFRVAEKPTSATLASVASAPYVDVVGEMLRESDNNTAELLLKELARRAGTSPATRTAGVAARAAALKKLGIDPSGVQAIDGSGLDRSDRASCDELMATLTTRPGGYDLEQMLAVAGQTGTLNDRFTSSPLSGKLRAKTGSLDGVTALVGIADPDAKVKLRFVFISNGAFSDAGGKALQDRLVAALATYENVPSAEELAP
jgi:D-alanyl-D-alanine carboxypeptidase/D-alanyl-D-alanine-endopeptidase (penicillin-binding protein 4)